MLFASNGTNGLYIKYRNFNLINLKSKYVIKLTSKNANGKYANVMNATVQKYTKLITANGTLNSVFHLPFLPFAIYSPNFAKDTLTAMNLDVKN